jgi:FtsP/CotA-like multicopper oxidase with cupredoxin domain
VVALHRQFISRRSFLVGSGIAAVSSLAQPRGPRAGSIADFRLVARLGRTHLVGGLYPETAVWSYNGAVPGPEIRLRQGDRLRIIVENQLAEQTTVHWHGVRVPNAMDGVPHLTQRPIAPGETFIYEFEVPDAGTYWYHPHERSFEQVGRGLSGPLIVEEREPIQVDRDVTWVLDDWRLLPDAQISDDFGNMMDTAMAGRIGNTVTVNGRLLDPALCLLPQHRARGPGRPVGHGAGLCATVHQARAGNAAAHRRARARLNTRAGGHLSRVGARARTRRPTAGAKGRQGHS